jgi:hypothetical protein
MIAARQKTARIIIDFDILADLSFHGFLVPYVGIWNSDIKKKTAKLLSCCLLSMEKF